MTLLLHSYWPFLFLLPGLVWIWWWQGRSETTLGKGRLRLSYWARGAACSLLLLALTAPELIWQSPAVFTIFAVDASQSIGPSQVEDSLSWAAALRERLGQDLTRTLVFAEDARAVDPASSGSVSREVASLGGRQTRFDHLLSAAVSQYPEGFVPRLVLLSDGRFTEPELDESLADAKRQHIEIFAREVQPQLRHDCWVEGADFTDAAAAGQPVRLEVKVYCQLPARGELEVWVADRRIVRQPVELPAGQQPISLTLHPDQPGLWILQIRLRAEGDPFPANDFFNLSVWVQERRRVWLMEGPGSSDSLLGDLQASQGFEVRSGSVLPQDLQAGGWSAVVLDDVHPDQLNPPQMQALSDFVKDGGGLVFLAGENSFGSEGYSDSEVEKLLPIRFQVQEEIGLALLLIMDKSNSMKGEKIELARQAILATLDQLSSDQFFGLLTFDHQAHLVVPLQRIGEGKAHIKELVESVTPGAHTNIMPALEQAFLVLAGHPAASRHMILLSDGRTYPDDYQRMVERIHEADITVSTVGIGQEADQELLTHIAEWGHGTNYFAADPQDLPKIFLQELLRMRSALEEKPLALRVRQGAEFLQGIPRESFPELQGIVRVKARPQSELILETSKEDPVLSRWHFGLGTVIFLASDLGERWTADWLTWPYLTRFATQMLRDAARSLDESPENWTVQRISPDRVRLRLSLKDDRGHLLTGLEPVLEVSHSGEVSRHRLRPVWGGEYAAEVELAEDDAAIAQLVTPPSDVSIAILPQYPVEYRHLPAASDRLRELCSGTGGRLNPSEEVLLHPASSRVPRRKELWGVLAGLGLLLLLAEIGIRRWP